jgi:PAS domain S-box-containing protein
MKQWRKRVMNKPKQVKVTKRLILGFSILILIFMSFGLFAIYSVQTISSLTRTIYDHPLVVSNAALQSNVSITKMHNSMKDVVLFPSTLDIGRSIEKVNEQEKKVYKYLDAVKMAIIGNEGKNLENEARKLFDNWRPIREEVIKLVLQGEIETAANITTGRGTTHVALLEEKMLGLTAYARKKAADFMYETDRVRSKLDLTLIIFLPSGILASLLVAFLVIRQIIFAEKELQESEERYRNFVNHASEGIYRIDFTTPIPVDVSDEELVASIAKHAIVGEVNEALSEMHRLRPEDMIGRLATDFVPEYGERAMLAVRTPHHQVKNAETRGVDKNGQSFYLFESYNAVVENGILLRIWGMQRDITARKRAEEERREKEKTENVIEVAGTVSHELSQPLQIITGYSEILLMGISEEDPTYKKLQKITKQVERMQILLRKLHTITRYKTKDYSGDMKIIDLDNSLERRHDKRFMPHKHAFITFEADDSSTEGQLIDISKGGLSFWCNKNQCQKNDVLKLNIHMVGEKCKLDKIPCITVSDSESTGDDLLSSGKIERCRVKFEELSYDQTERIDYFIQNHTTAKSD